MRYELLPGSSTVTQRLNVCDLNAVETRCGAWVAQCTSLLDVFKSRPGKPNGNDPYIDFSATKLLGISYEKMEADLKSTDKAVKKAAKDNRQTGKVGVLSCIYRIGGGGWAVDSKTGDKIKTGLFGYCENYGIQLTQEQTHQIVRVFRESYLEIPQTWYTIESAYTDVLKEGTTRVKRELGPSGSIKFDKLVVSQDSGKHCILRIQLPSGRFLHYIDARVESRKKPWTDEDGEPVFGPTLVYSGVNQTTKTWSTNVTSHGGKVFENIVQGIARDILAEKLLRFEEIGLPVCLHVHDEGVSTSLDDPFSPGVQDMIEIMSQPVDWAPGLLLGADGFEGGYYRK